jgi:NAD(P)-dependent dehydrogenase (short-subunit alcohol dehydrogenase family)
MGTFIITGGNSGIGLEIGRQLGALQHRVVLLGRDAKKNEAAVATVGSGAVAHAVDLSTNAGVRAIAEKLGAAHPVIDGIVHAAGMLTLENTRTADGLHPVFSVNYLSRYHLTQRLMPQLKAAPKPKVVLIVAGVPLGTKLDFNRFPRFDPFPGMSALSQIQIGNHHYAQHLAKAEPTLKVALCNVGLVKTEIMREMPAMFRFGLKVLVPLVGVSAATAASNPVSLCTSDDWPTGHYWPKPGRREVTQPMVFDASVVEKVIALSRELTQA